MRVHYIANPSINNRSASASTTVTKESTMNTTNTTLASMPNDDLDAAILATVTPQQPTVEQPLTASLCELLSTGPQNVKFSVLSSFLSSLNLMLVSRCRVIIESKEQGRERDTDRFSSVDDRNEADDEAGDNAACYDQGTVDEAQAQYAGQKQPISNMYIASRLAVIRSYVHLLQEAMRHSNVNPYEPRSLYESIEFLRSQIPGEAKPTDMLMRIASAATQGRKTPEQCAADRNNELVIERKTLNDMADELVAMGDGLTAEYLPDEQAVEAAFDQLPAHVLMNVYTAAVNAQVTAYNSAYGKLMKRGNLASGGDMVVAAAMYKRGVHTLKQFGIKYSADLAEHEQRGGQLKELKPLM